LVKDKEIKEFARAADLLGLSKGTKEVFVKTANMKVKIKKVTIGELAEIMKVSKDSEVDQYIWLTFKCLVQPKLNAEEVRKLPFEVLLEISSHIAKLSGLDKDSLDRITNLLGETESSTPSSS